MNEKAELFCGEPPRAIREEATEYIVTTDN